MKILHLYKDYFPVEGGIENHIKMLAEAQAKRGHAVTVLVHSLDARTHIENMNGVRVIFAARLATISSTPLGVTMPRLLANEHPDIAHLHFPYPWGELSYDFFGHARRTVITYHSDIVRQKFLRVLYAPLLPLVFNRVNRIIATSPNYIASSPVLARWKEKCVVIPLAIDPAPFNNIDANKVAEIRARFPADRKLLLFVGKLRYYKGLPYLLQAMTELSTAHLLLVGSGPMAHELRELAQELGIDAHVTFTGKISDDDLPAYYAACDVFVLPSSERSEAFGAVQLEAMAAGKPVVCTDLGTGTSFVNVNGETGLVVPAQDSHALASGITRLIDDSALRRQMGMAGRARVHQEFTLDKMVDRVMRLYNLILENN